MNNSLSYPSVPHIILTWNYLIIPICIFLTSLIIHSLKNLPLSKQSLIVRMYEDSLRVNVLLVLFWGCSSSIWSLLEGMNDEYKKKTAEIIAYLDQMLSLMLVLNLLSIGLFRILRVKYKVLDPFSIWVDDEGKSLGILRGLIIIVGLLVNILIYISFSMPPVFHMIKDGNLNNAPISSMVILTFDIGVLIFCGILHISASMLQKYQELRFIQKYEYQGSDATRTENNNRVTKCLIFCCKNDTEPINISGVVICFLMNALFIIFGCIFVYHLQPYFNTDCSFWAIILLFITNQGVIIPILIVLKYASLKVIIVRSLQNLKYRLYTLLNIQRGYLNRLWRSSRVENQLNDVIV